MPARRDHFTPNPLPGIAHHTTPRVERILSLLDEYRLLRSTHLKEFLKYYFNEGYSEQTTTRCLRWLMDEGQIIRIRKDPDSNTVAHGSLPKIYGRNTRRNQAINERRKKPSIVVPHALDVASTMAFSVVRACRESQGMMRFDDAPDILARQGSAAVKATAKPFTWPVQVFYRNEMHHCTVTPDRLFDTYFTATARPCFFVLEEDRSTEPHERDDYSFDSGTSLFRKFVTYVFAYHAQVPLHRYNIRGFRILFVTDSHKRIQRALEIWKLANDVLKAFQKQSQLAIRAVPNNVLHCVVRPSLRNGTIFTVPWVNGRGEQVTIDHPPFAAT